MFQMRSKIGHRIVVRFCALVLVVVGGGGWVLYRVALGQLEKQMANHLVSVTQLVANGLDGDVIAQIRPNYGVYDRLQTHLRHNQVQVGADRIVVFSPEGSRFFDTRTSNSFGLPYARMAFDRAEIARVLSGEPTHSVAFYDDQGNAFQTGYAPLFAQDRVVAVVAVDLGIGFVDGIETFQNLVYLFGVAGVVLTVLVGLGLSKTLTRPIGQLVQSARVIGQGNLDASVAVSTQDELGELAQTLDVMRQRLAARDEQLRQMLAGVAHEIRNPLGGIELYAGFIADDLEESDPRREHILKVISEVRHLNQVITDFLTFARPVSLEAERVVLNDIVSDAVFLVSPEIEQRRIDMNVDLGADQTIQADATQIKGVVVNVLKNAIQAMSEGGVLDIELGSQLNYIILKIKDSGKGISEEDQKRIFEPFFTTKEQGSGLGLAIVQQVLERHKSELKIESELGKGTVVEMKFERAE